MAEKNEEIDVDFDDLVEESSKENIDLDSDFGTLRSDLSDEEEDHDSFNSRDSESDDEPAQP